MNSYRLEPRGLLLPINVYVPGLAGQHWVGWWMEREKEIGRGVGYGVNVNVFVCVSRKGLTSSENNSHQL